MSHQGKRENGYGCPIVRGQHLGCSSADVRRHDHGDTVNVHMSCQIQNRRRLLPGATWPTAQTPALRDGSSEDKRNEPPILYLS